MGVVVAVRVRVVVVFCFLGGGGGARGEGDGGGGGGWGGHLEMFGVGGCGFDRWWEKFGGLRQGLRGFIYNRSR